MTGITAALRGRRGVSDETRGYVQRFLRERHRGVDVSRLDDGEVTQLAELIREVKTEDGGTNFTVLGRKRLRAYERLVERAIAAPGAFAAERDEQNLRDRAAQIAARAARIATPTAQREQAFIAKLGTALRDGDVDVEDLACLLPVLGALMLDEGLSPGASVEAGELRVDIRFGVAPASRDDVGTLSHWRQSLERLHESGYLSVSRLSGEYRIRLGPKSEAALS